jgi:hypothetical protein
MLFAEMKEELGFYDAATRVQSLNNWEVLSAPEEEEGDQGWDLEQDVFQFV